MLGFGLGLDTPWQGVAWALIGAGALAAGAGLWSLGRFRRSNGASVSGVWKG